MTSYLVLSLNPVHVLFSSHLIPTKLLVFAVLGDTYTYIHIMHS